MLYEVLRGEGIQLYSLKGIPQVRNQLKRPHQFSPNRALGLTLSCSMGKHGRDYFYTKQCNRLSSCIPQDVILHLFIIFMLLVKRNVLFAEMTLYSWDCVLLLYIHSKYCGALNVCFHRASKFSQYQMEKWVGGVQKPGSSRSSSFFKH